jgi:hypothetical protein
MATLPSFLRRGADRLGAGAAWLCAVHCAAWPLLVALLPALGAWNLAGLEEGFVVFAGVLGLASLTTGYRRHRIFRAFWFLVPGLVLLMVGAFTDVHGNLVWHAVLMTAGGVLVGVAHVVNLRLSHGHVHDASCGHLPVPDPLAPPPGPPLRGGTTGRKA